MSTVALYILVILNKMCYSLTFGVQMTITAVLKICIHLKALGIVVDYSHKYRLKISEL